MTPRASGGARAWEVNAVRIPYVNWDVSAGFSDSDFARLKSRCWPSGFLSRDSRECSDCWENPVRWGCKIADCPLGWRLAPGNLPLVWCLRTKTIPQILNVWNLLKFSSFHTSFLPTPGESLLRLRTLDNPRQYPYFKGYGLICICEVP